MYATGQRALREVSDSVKLLRALSFCRLLFYSAPYTLLVMLTSCCRDDDIDLSAHRLVQT